MPQLTTSRRRPVFVLYRSGAGVVRERFSRTNIGAALARAEFIGRVENCRVYLEHGYKGKRVLCVS